jgi:hypothetical protein
LCRISATNQSIQIFGGRRVDHAYQLPMNEVPVALLSTNLADEWCEVGSSVALIRPIG